MKVVFKNGKEVKVIQEVAEIINSKLIQVGGSSQWQTFSDENGNVFLIINLFEVAYICKDGDCLN